MAVALLHVVLVCFYGCAINHHSEVGVNTGTTLDLVVAHTHTHTHACMWRLLVTPPPPPPPARLLCIGSASLN